MFIQCKMTVFFLSLDRLEQTCSGMLFEWFVSVNEAGAVSQGCNNYLRLALF